MLSLTVLGPNLTAIVADYVWVEGIPIDEIDVSGQVPEDENPEDEKKEDWPSSLMFMNGILSVVSGGLYIKSFDLAGKQIALDTCANASSITYLSCTYLIGVEEWAPTLTAPGRLGLNYSHIVHREELGSNYQSTHFKQTRCDGYFHGNIYTIHYYYDKTTSGRAFLIKGSIWTLGWDSLDTIEFKDGDPRIGDPCDIAVSERAVFVLDDLYRITVLETDLTIRDRWTHSRLVKPVAIAVFDRKLYIVDRDASAVFEFTFDGVLERTWCDLERLQLPCDVTFGNGIMLVLCAATHQVVVFKLW